MMRFNRCIWARLAVLLAIFTCGPLSPSESCGDVGGVADESLFNEYFKSMALFNTLTGNPGGISSEGEIEFTPAVELETAFENKTNVSIHTYLLERKGGGKVLFKKTRSFPPGKNSFVLGTFSKCDHIVRVIVDETLIKNLPFQIEQGSPYICHFH